MGMITKSVVWAALILALTACAGPRTFVSPNAAMERNVALSLLLEYVSNQDQLLSGPEFEEAIRADFSTLDRNSDGSLDSIEVSAENDRRWQESGSSSTPLIDWNTDGFVDFTEFTSTLHSTFTLLDEDNDGNLSVEELAIMEDVGPPRAALPGGVGAPNRAPGRVPVGG
jgi:Ca2+-binding EF-hand superfamily protein